MLYESRFAAAVVTYYGGELTFFYTYIYIFESKVRAALILI